MSAACPVHRIPDCSPLLNGCSWAPPAAATEAEAPWSNPAHDVKADVIAYYEGATVHASPVGDAGVMPCCGRTPFEVAATDLVTLTPVLVTCTSCQQASSARGSSDVAAVVERALHTGVCGEAADACCWTDDEIVPCSENDLSRLAAHVAAALAAQPAAPQPAEGAVYDMSPGGFMQVQPTEGGALTEADATEFARTHRPNYVTEGVWAPDPDHSTERTRVKCDGDGCDFYAERPRWHDALDQHAAHVAQELLALLAARSPRPEGDACCRIAVDCLTQHDAESPEGVTVTEWAVALDNLADGTLIVHAVNRDSAVDYAGKDFHQELNPRLVSRQVTEWAEVSGDTEAGGDR